jgi:hypothetical protein
LECTEVGQAAADEPIVRGDCRRRPAGPINNRPQVDNLPH